MLLKLSAQDLREANILAQEMRCLMAAKDCQDRPEVTLAGHSFEVPRDIALKAINERIRQIDHLLAAKGIELVPPTADDVTNGYL